MLTRENSVVFIAAASDACALWRLYMPHVAMPGSSFFHFGAQSPDFAKIAGHDICVVQRCCTIPQFELIKACKQLGMKVVYDLDDNVWEVPEYNPAHIPLQHYRDGFGACIRMVDVCSVSTQVLAKAVKRHVKQLTVPVVVCGNRIEESMFTAPAFPSSQLTVGWAGSSSHIGDLRLIDNAVLSCARERPDVMFEYRGCVVDEAAPVRALPNWRHRLWTPVAEYVARMPVWGWSVSLAPVTEHEFNNSKSCIKMVEAGYCGIPCLASWVDPYSEFCSHDDELRWLLCAGASSFSTKLRVLLNEPERREALGMRMRNVVAKHYSYRQPHEGWAEVFRAARAVAL